MHIAHCTMHITECTLHNAHCICSNLYNTISAIQCACGYSGSLSVFVSLMIFLPHHFNVGIRHPEGLFVLHLICILRTAQCSQKFLAALSDPRTWP